MPDLGNYQVQLTVGSVTMYALRKQKFSIAAQPGQLWKRMIAGWCIGITVLHVWFWLSWTKCRSPASLQFHTGR